MANESEAHADHHMVRGHESAEDHGEDHGQDDHAHGGGEALGPIDAPAWGAAVLGIALGIVVVAALMLAGG